MTWDAVPGAAAYDLIAGDLAGVKSKPNVLALGQVTVLASGTSVTEFQEPGGNAPPPGGVVFYVIQYRLPDGSASSYGSESAPLPREPNSCGGACP